MSTASFASDRTLRFGLRVRLALGTALFALVAGVGAGLGLSAFTRLLTYRAHREQVLTLTEALAPSCARSLATGDLAGLDDLLSEALRHARTPNARLLVLRAYDAAGRLVLETDVARDASERADGAVDEDFLRCALDGGAACWHRLDEPGPPEILALSTPAVSGLRWGTLVAVFDTGPLAARTQTLRWVIISGVALVDVLLFLVVWGGVSLLVLSPLARLHAAVQRIEGGDLGARAGLDRSDELGLLGRAFDAMAARLQAHTADLEREVALRSAHIQRQNEELARVNQHLGTMNQQLERLATTDGLTGLANRREIERAMEFELDRARRVAHPFCLLLLDLDHFKAVNDTWGHQRGDEVLVNVADALRCILRNTDLQARWGGEEFLVVLLDTGREAGLRTAEKVRAAVEALGMRDPAGQPLPITVSVGVACFPEDGSESRSLFAAADEALYRAKQAGRNRVVVAGPQVTGLA